MTRRPLLSDEEFELRSKHSQVPGAKMWSESPVAQLGPRRKPRTAASAPGPVIPPPWQEGPEYGEAGNWRPEYVWNIVYTGPYQWWSPGDIAVSMFSAFGASSSITLPSGYTQLLSGSYGNIAYKAGYYHVPASPDWRAYASPLYVNSPSNYIGYAAASTTYFVDDGRVPSVSVITTGTSSTQTLTGGSGTMNSALAGHSTQNNWVIYANGWPTYTWIQQDPVAHVWCRDTEWEAPAVETGPIYWNQVVDHVEFSWTWS